MKVVILAGGFGTRISEESHLRPKPMIEIGERPILWHIMKIYSHYGFNDFVICLGYKAYIIKEFFADYFLHMSDVTFDMESNRMTVHNNYCEPWKVTLVDTGLNTMTGGRLKRVQPYLGDENFMLTYGDGVADINISELLKFHNEHGRASTITAVNVNQRFGVLNLDENSNVTAFREKASSDANLINGGFMVLNKTIFDYIEDDSTVLEKRPLEMLASKGQMSAFKHSGFWQCMDTQRDKQQLETLWDSGQAPWRCW